MAPPELGYQVRQASLVIEGPDRGGWKGRASRGLVADDADVALVAGAGRDCMTASPIGLAGILAKALPRRLTGRSVSR